MSGGEVRLSEEERAAIYPHVPVNDHDAEADVYAAVERILADRLAAVGKYPEADRSYLSLEWERLAKSSTARAEAAEAEIAELRARLGNVEALVEEWDRDDDYEVVLGGQQVVVDRLRAALASPTTPAWGGQFRTESGTELADEYWCMEQEEHRKVPCCTACVPLEDTPQEQP